MKSFKEKKIVITFCVILTQFDGGRECDQIWPMWPDLVKFRHFTKLFNLFGKVLRVY